jgi:hypothetical protein
LASLGEGSFRKPAPPKFQDGRQVDILDFVFQAVTQERIDRLTGNLFCGLGFTRGRFLSKTSAA